jgi:hypothetical protein
MAYTTIDNPTIYFNTLTWTGNDADSRDITGVGFQPDWVWGKRRDDAAGHNLLDVVRGAGENGELASSTNGIEGSNAQDRFGFLSAFLSDGFRVEDGSEASGDKAYWNQNSATYVAWNWKAGGSASSNSDGDITSSVSANQTAGFSIVTYTATSTATDTVGHGLGAKPSLIIVKERNGTNHWCVALPDTLGNNEVLQLNLTNAVFAGSAGFNDTVNTGTTSSVFVSGNGGLTGTSGQNYVAYCFAAKKGYSKFGTYTGNGNADGTFVYTGFKPAWVFVKKTSSTGHWVLIDNKRDPINVTSLYLLPDDSGAEASFTDRDLLSNGFKMRNSNTDRNASGATFIYAAFAESPFVNSNGVPNNAR